MIVRGKGGRSEGKEYIGRQRKREMVRGKARDNEAKGGKGKGGRGVRGEVMRGREDMI